MQKVHTRTDGLIGDYCDGWFLKNDPYFQSNANALQLVLYFDEIEVWDALASHKGQHKLGLPFLCLFLLLLKFTFLYLKGG